MNEVVAVMSPSRHVRSLKMSCGQIASSDRMWRG
jgi:hypothetical protein